MDPNNERRVFEMLVNNVAKPGKSQFFYVTPKLQTNLPYNEYVNCITIFNGPYTNHNDFFEDVWGKFSASPIKIRNISKILKKFNINLTNLLK